MPQDDETLLEQAKAGEKDAFILLLERYVPDMRRRLAGRIPKSLRPLIDEDDILQETFAEAFREVHRFNSRLDGSFAGWLQRIAYHNLLDAVRGLNAGKRDGCRRIDECPGGERALSLVDIIASSGTSPSQGAIRSELGTSLQRALRELPDAYRRVVVLYDLEFQSAAQTAAAVGCSVGAVFMRRARAHRMLRDLLGRFSDHV